MSHRLEYVTPGISKPGFPRFSDQTARDARYADPLHSILREHERISPGSPAESLHAPACRC